MHSETHPYISRLINVINNLPCSGADIHEKSNILCILAGCYKLDKNEYKVLKIIKRAEKYIEDKLKK